MYCNLAVAMQPFINICICKSKYYDLYTIFMFLLHIMISRRENLLMRPWQQKRFEMHRRKVSSALPAIDNKPPASFNHVSSKLKKQQMERERTVKIEKDNLILLRKLNHIRKTNRIDNYWTSPPPDFLSREAIYESNRTKDIDRLTVEVTSLPIQVKSRCLACCPNYSPTKPIIPEERVPWAPVKPSVGKRRSQSVPLPKVSPNNFNGNCSQSNKIKDAKQEKSARTKTCKEKSQSAGKRMNNCKQLPDFCQRLILNRGDLKLVVRFPPDTSVTFRDAFSTKLLSDHHQLCLCRAMSSN